MEKTTGSRRVTEEAHAYTPGLKIKRNVVVTKDRILPIRGDVLVKEGDKVSHDRVVAKTEVRGDPFVVKASFQMGIGPEELHELMLKEVGDLVHEDEPIAMYKMFFGLSKRIVLSPAEGTIESISDVTGQIILRGSPIPVEVDAYIPGEITKIMPREGVRIEANAALIQGIFGIGGETHGKLKFLVDSPDQVLKADSISPEDKDHILVGGSYVTLEALRKMVNVGASGVVVGGIMSEDLKEFTGEEIGVAITGHEELGLTLIVTEGFGQMSMSKRTFDLLKQFEGYMSSINGTTQIRAGVMRPEIIIPHEITFEKLGLEDELSMGMKPGTPVRIIREPYFGAIGNVFSLPIELQKVETESSVRVVEVEIEDGQRVMVPRANVEIIEE
jgi:hypothetical protein